MKRICVYCGARPGLNFNYSESAIELVDYLATANISIVYGGAGIGVMGALADSALSKGMEVIGVMPKSLVEREVAHSGLTELIVVNTMHERKAKMAELADGFIALPGGLGTLEELFEVLTWAQLRFHNKPCGLLNSHEYYTKLLDFLDHAVREGFISQPHRELLHSEASAATLVASMLSVTTE